jgi:hypothetical protein
MTARILRIDEHQPDAVMDSAVSSDTRPAAAGWDPYEVWRTRVLLPRLQDAEKHPAHEVPAADNNAAAPHRRAKR